MIRATNKRCAIGLLLATLFGLSANFITAADRPGTPSAESGRVLERYSLRGPVQRTRLPKALREVSGLVADTLETNRSEVLLHDDNSSQIWRFDYQRGKLLTPLATDQPLRGDFEGIAALGRQWLLADSSARLYLFSAEGELLASHLHNPTALAQPSFVGQCNFEGLAVLPDQSEALIPCKYPFFTEAGLPPADDRLVYLFRHALAAATQSPATAQLTTQLSSNSAPKPPLTVDVSPILARYRLRRLRPSAVEVVDGHLLVLAGKERVVLEATLDGELLGWRRLSWLRHRQAEGLTVGADNELIIADEGRWLGGTIAVYPATLPLSGQRPSAISGGSRSRFASVDSGSE